MKFQSRVRYGEVKLLMEVGAVVLACGMVIYCAQFFLFLYRVSELNSFRDILFYSILFDSI